MLLLPLSAQLFVPGLHQGVVVRQPLRSGGIGMASKPLSVDVSDLGVTMDDLKMPINSLEVEASGCESTSRISPDTGCVWSETASRVEARSQKRHHPRRRAAAACTTPVHARFTRQRSRGCHATPPCCGRIRPACSHARAGDADHPGAARPACRLARGRDDGDYGHDHGVWQGGLVVRARGRSRARPDGGRPAEVAQAAGKLLRASLGPAPAPHAPAAPPGRETAACATFSLPDPGAPWLGGSGLRADRGGAGRAADDAHAARGDPHRRQGAERPLGRADQADRGR